MNFQNTLQQKLEEGYSFRTMDYISQGFHWFGKNPGPYIGYLLLSFIILMIAGIIPLGGTLISGPITAGYILYAHQQRKGNAMFDNFFHGFNHFLPLLGYTILSSIIIVAPIFVTMIPFFGMLSMNGSSEAGIPSIFFILVPLIFIVVLLLSIGLVFAMPMIVIGGFGVIDAISGSFKLAFKNFGSIFGLAFLLFLINILGALCLIVGLLVTIPASAIAMYSAFHDVFEIDNEDSGDGSNPLKHFVS